MNKGIELYNKLEMVKQDNILDKDLDNFVREERTLSIKDYFIFCYKIERGFNVSFIISICKAFVEVLFRILGFN